MSTNLLPKMLQFIQLSSALNKRAMAELKTAQDSAKAAADRVPALLEHLLKSGSIADVQAETAKQMLGNHGQTLELLKNAVDKLVEARTQVKRAAADLGSPADAADDPAGSLNSTYVGARSTEKRASDVAMLRGLGLPV